MNTYCFVKYISDLYGVYINIYIFQNPQTIKKTLYKENCLKKKGNAQREQEGGAGAARRSRC